MAIQWSGPTAGLGNRMLALASASAVAGLLNTEIEFPWINSPLCPCDYNDLFSHIPGLRVEKTSAGHGRMIHTDRWNPVYIVKDFEKALGVRLKKEDYYLRFIHALRTILFSRDIREHAAAFKKKQDSVKTLAIHIRRTDRMLYHRNWYVHPLRAIYIARNTGFMKSIHYAVLPESMIVQMENNTLARLVQAFLSENPHACYSVYSDYREGVQDMVRSCRKAGILELQYEPGRSGCQGPDYWQDNLRKTRMQDALKEMLEMSHSTCIAQNNPASTFALVASIRGRVPIVSGEPTHEFWKTITTILGDAPNRIHT